MVSITSICRIEAWPLESVESLAALGVAEALGADERTAIREFLHRPSAFRRPGIRIERARHPQRPYPMDFIERIFTDFSEIHGDRAFGDDEAVACGMARLGDEEVLVIGNRKGGTTKERVKRNFGMPNPEGYRKALRCMRIAEKFGRPVISFIDLPGAYPGLGAEERGQAEAIARNILRNVAPARAHDLRDHRRGRLGRRAGPGRQRPRADP